MSTETITDGLPVPADVSKACPMVTRPTLQMIFICKNDLQTTTLELRLAIRLGPFQAADVSLGVGLAEEFIYCREADDRRRATLLQGEHEWPRPTFPLMLCPVDAMSLHGAKSLLYIVVDASAQVPIRQQRAQWKCCQKAALTIGHQTAQALGVGDVVRTLAPSGSEQRKQQQPCPSAWQEQGIEQEGIQVLLCTMRCCSSLACAMPLL